MTLGVTFESAILCDISQGLSYTWTIRTSEGWPVPLPPGVSTRRQTITVPGYFLELGNYTALARVRDRLTGFPPASEQELSPCLPSLLYPRQRGLHKCGWAPEKCFSSPERANFMSEPGQSNCENLVLLTKASCASALTVSLR